MQVYNGSLVLRNTGIDPLTGKSNLNAGINKNVTIRVADEIAGNGALAIIYDIAGDQIANPTQSDDNGNYVFKVNSGTYDIITNEGTIDQQIQQAVPILSGSGSTISETPPAFPIDGERWTRCTDMKGFIYYVDDNSAQWVEDRPSYGTDTIGDLSQAYGFAT